MTIALIIGAVLVLAGAALWALGAPSGLFWIPMVALVVIIGMHATHHNHVPWLGWVASAILLIVALLIAWFVNETPKNHKLWAWLPGAVAAGLVIGLALTSSATTASAANGDGNGQSGATNVAFDPAVDLIPGAAKCTTDTYNTVSAMPAKPGDNNARQFPTAVSSPFKATTASGVTTETMTEVCTNPTWFEQALQFMETPEWRAIPGATSNDGWLKTIRSDIASHGLEGFIVKDEASGALTTTDTYRKYASWINVVLMRFSETGEQSPTSKKNWELSVAQDPTKIPVTQLAADQESKPAWTYDAVDKNGKCLFVWGVNALDKRLELFECGGTTPYSSTPPTTPGTPTHPSTPSTTPPTTPTCESVYGAGWTGHYPVCKDPASQDPQPQGHNKPGGGGVAPPVTTGPSAPAAGNPPATYVPPAPPAATHTTPPQVNTATQPSSGSVPTVDPATQPPNNGVVGNSGNPTNPDPVPSSGGSCNSVFQSC